MLRRVPEIAKIKQKMIFASAKHELRQALSGITADVEASYPDEIGYETGAYGSSNNASAATREERSDTIVFSACTD